MNTHSQADRDRLLELLADRALFGLDNEAESELTALQPMHPEIHDQEMDSIVALLDASRPTVAAPAKLPDSLRRKILSTSQSKTATEQPPAEPPISTPVSPAKRPTSSFSRRLILVACTAAATLLAIRGLDALRGSNAPVAEQRDELIKNAPDAVQLAWTEPVVVTGTVSGDVVWSDSKQKGFMTFKGLPINDPKLEQYQLWIFENPTDETPVDGGVFDIVGGNVVVPIDAKIKVENAKMFAVTIEKPGGVVVSKRKRLPLLAKVIN